MEEYSAGSLKENLKDYFLGALSSLTPVSSRNGIILLYHSIGSHSQKSLNTRRFRNQMKFIGENFHVCTLRDFYETDDSTSSKKTVVVTFDDGVLDNYQEAYPVLQDLNLPATFFISTKLIGERLETPSVSLPMMESGHLCELTEQGHEIGSHGYSHRKLTNLSSRQLKKEVTSSKKILEDILGESVITFAYPHGEYDESVIDQVKQAGFRCAVTTEESPVFPQNFNSYEIPRRIIHNRLGPRGFRAKLNSSYDYYRKILSFFKSD